MLKQSVSTQGTFFCVGNSMTMVSTDNQREQFAARISRIHSADKQGLTTIMVGDEQLCGRDPTQRGRQAHRSSSSGLIVTLFRFCLAFAIGAGSMLAGRVAAFHFLGDGTTEITNVIGMMVQFGGDIGVAIVLSVLFAKICGLRGKPEHTVELLGFLALMYYEPAFIELFPDLWVMMFSPEYIAATL